MSFTDDKFYQSLTDNEKEIFLEKVKNKQTGSGEINNKWHGEIKYCPTCNDIRTTTCSACGCGSCLTCRYRFTCMPELPSQIINMNKISNKSVDWLTRYTDSNRLDVIGRCVSLLLTNYFKQFGIDKTFNIKLERFIDYNGELRDRITIDDSNKTL